MKDLILNPKTCTRAALVLACALHGHGAWAQTELPGDGLSQPPATAEEQEEDAAVALSDTEAETVRGGTYVALPTLNQVKLYAAALPAVLLGYGLTQYVIPKPKNILDSWGQAVDTVVCGGGGFSLNTLGSNAQLAAMASDRRQFDRIDFLIGATRAGLSGFYIGLCRAAVSAYYDGPDGYAAYNQTIEAHDRRQQKYILERNRGGEAAGRKILEDYARQEARVETYSEKAQSTRDKVRQVGRTLRQAEFQRSLCFGAGIFYPICIVQQNSIITKQHRHLRNLYKAMDELTRATAKAVLDRGNLTGVRLMDKNQLPRKFGTRYTVSLQ